MLQDVSDTALFPSQQAQRAAEPSALLLLVFSPPSCGTAQAVTALSHPFHSPTTSSSTIFSLCQFELCWPNPCQIGVWVSAG